MCAWSSSRPRITQRDHILPVILTVLGLQTTSLPFLLITDLQVSIEQVPTQQSSLTSPSYPDIGFNMRTAQWRIAPYHHHAGVLYTCQWKYFFPPLKKIPLDTWYWNQWDPNSCCVPSLPDGLLLDLCCQLSLLWEFCVWKQCSSLICHSVFFSIICFIKYWFSVALLNLKSRA